MDRLPPVPEMKVGASKAKRKISVEVINLEGDDIPQVDKEETQVIPKQEKHTVRTSNSNPFTLILGSIVFFSVAFLLWTKSRK